MRISPLVLSSVKICQAILILNGKLIKNLGIVKILRYIGSDMYTASATTFFGRGPVLKHNDKPGTGSNMYTTWDRVYNTGMKICTSSTSITVVFFSLSQLCISIEHNTHILKTFLICIAFNVLAHSKNVQLHIKK